MKFICYRTLHAWGASEWRIVRREDNEILEHFRAETARCYASFEQYQDCECYWIEPPIEWIRSTIEDLYEYKKRMETNVKTTEKSIREYEELLERRQDEEEDARSYILEHGDSL